MERGYKGPRATVKEEVYLSSFIFLVLFITNILLSLLSGTNYTICEIMKSSFLIFIISGFIGLVIYIILNKSGYYDPDAYEIVIGEDRIRIRNRNKITEIDRENINRLEIKGRVLKVWPKDYYYFIDRSDGMERHNYYVAMENKLPLQFLLPALNRRDKKRLKEAIEEFKRINGI